MASASVYYKFKSQREPSKIAFDGTGISVWDIKKEIITQNRMDRDLDFHLTIFDESGTREFRNDDQLIPRSSLVIAKRLPAQSGRGSAYKYVSHDGSSAPARGGRPNKSGPTVNGPQGTPQQGGNMYRGQMTVRFDGRDPAPEQQQQPMSQAAPQQGSSSDGGGEGGDEASKIAAMFQASTDHWNQAQEQMSHATFRGRPGAGPPRGGGRGGPPRPTPSMTHQTQSREPPGPGYTCHRCGRKGHWIQECPTNEMPDWDGKPKLKRTTGIPRSMLKTIDDPTPEQRAAGMMITADGSIVIAQADTETWQKQKGKSRALTRSDVYDMRPTDSSLACGLCSKLLREAVKTPCCGTRFCEEDIQTHLLEHDFVCPECEKGIKDLDRLEMDQETRDKVKEYVEEAIKKSEHEVESAATGNDKQAEGPSTQKREEEESSYDDRGGGDGYGQGTGAQGNNAAWGPGDQLQEMMRQFASMPSNPIMTNMMIMQVNNRLSDPSINLGERQRLTGQMQYLQSTLQNQMQSMMTGGPMTTSGMTWGQQQAMQATNPFSHRAPNSDADSPYTRTALSAREKGRAKRDRPTDSFEVDKRARY